MASLWLQWEPHTARFSYARTLSCLKSFSRGNVTTLRFLARQHCGLSFDENLTHFHRQPSLAPNSLCSSRGFNKPGCTRVTTRTESPSRSDSHTGFITHMLPITCTKDSIRIRQQHWNEKFLFTIKFAGTITELQSLLRTEKISSWQVARGWKISRGTEREQVTDTSMDSPLNSSAGVISKSCLDIKTNKNIFLPETFFPEYLNSFVENWLPF